ncbi:7alpha-cephem-methoxylase p8 chain related protein [Phlyctema vagabunda]|uniref:7alpha-cephem-methoxylase p8 chain related protein n=1 Tax=Phlyctema vagabunda TaxID=108571 RepID=A0ABR4PXS5_9HELO
MTTTAPLQATAAHNLSASARAEAGAQYANQKVPSTFIPRGDAVVSLNYFRPPEDGSVPFNYVETPPEGHPQRNFGDFDINVPIKDIRGQESAYNLDHDAFAVITPVPESAEKDFVDDESIKKNYYPELEKLLLENVEGSNKVFLFDHTIRRTSPDAHRAPVTRVHIDQTPTSAKKRVYQHLPEEAEKLLQGRYRIINIWRPLNGPVQGSPLAFASSASLEDNDVVPIEHRYPDRTGETAGIRYNDGQKWHYLSGMKNNERLLLECFDSDALKQGSKVQGGRVPHTAFVDPRTPEGAVGRESIEVRALVFGP